MRMKDYNWKVKKDLSSKPGLLNFSLFKGPRWLVRGDQKLTDVYTLGVYTSHFGGKNFKENLQSQNS